MIETGIKRLRRVCSNSIEYQTNIFFGVQSIIGLPKRLLVQETDLIGSTLYFYSEFVHTEFPAFF